MGQRLRCGSTPVSKRSRRLGAARNAPKTPRFATSLCYLAGKILVDSTDFDAKLMIKSQLLYQLSYRGILLFQCLACAVTRCK
jgi:hypothetical protein